MTSVVVEVIKIQIKTSSIIGLGDLRGCRGQPHKGNPQKSCLVDVGGRPHKNQNLLTSFIFGLDDLGGHEVDILKQNMLIGCIVDLDDLGGRRGRPFTSYGTTHDVYMQRFNRLALKLLIMIFLQFQHQKNFILVQIRSKATYFSIIFCIFI